MIIASLYYYYYFNYIRASACDALSLSFSLSVFVCLKYHVHSQVGNNSLFS